MDWSQVLKLLNGLAQPVLAFFTLGLVFATILLWRSTKRYADATERLVEATKLSMEATKDMAQSTYLSAETAERLLRVEHWNLVKILRQQVTHDGQSADLRSALYCGTSRVADLTDTQKDDWDTLVAEVERAYRSLPAKLVDDILLQN